MRKARGQQLIRFARFRFNSVIKSWFKLPSMIVVSVNVDMNMQLIVLQNNPILRNPHWIYFKKSFAELGHVVQKSSSDDKMSGIIRKNS
jgi:hypothetical protein